MSVLDKLSEKLSGSQATDTPEVGSFMEFLTDHAQVKVQGGRYIPYSFVGREALIPVVEAFDLVLGSHTGEPLSDSSIDVCGGAQFGKTILALNFGVYSTACGFLNWGYYLPDDDLVEGIVDTKLRPDVIEQIDWLGPLMEVGKTEDKRGRSVNRKGAFQVSNGERKAFGMIRGMGKIPTSFSADVVMEDEKDDINASRSKYLTGRMAASDLRLKSSIGTQRLHSAGQHKQFEDGSQGIVYFTDREKLSPEINLEENWPAIARYAITGEPREDDPKLTETGAFARGDETWAFKPGATYYFAHPDTGRVIDRTKPKTVHLRPDRIEQRRWSFRLSQFCFAALKVEQFVSRWQAAVRDPEMMVVFRCDVMAMPANTEQALTPATLLRSRTVEEPFDLSLSKSKEPVFGGMDTGNRCWMFARESFGEGRKRAKWAEDIPLSKMVSRGEALFHRLGMDCLFIDARPAVNEARTLCYKLNKLEGIKWPQPADPDKSYIRFPGGLVWNGKKARWENLRCAVVEFTRKEGAGIIHKLGRDDQGAEEWFFPIIQCNRFEAIDRVVREFLTPDENQIRVVDDEVLQDPIMRLARDQAGSPPIVATLDAHLIKGSQREKKADGETGDFVDKCDNHLLLANAYSALAELSTEAGTKASTVEPETFSIRRARRYV